MAFQDPTDPEEELPDWLQGMDEDAAEAGSGSAATASTGDLPDWLQAGEERPASPFASDTAEDMPDWLGSEADAASSTPPASSTPAGEEVPEWLNSIRSQEAENQPPAVSGADAGGDDEIPSWLEDIRQREQSEQYTQGADEETSDYIERIRQMKAQDEAAAEPDDTSGWLRGLEDEGDTAHVPAGKAEEKTAGEWTGWGTSEDDTDDWLASLGEKGVEFDTGPSQVEEDKLSTVQRQKIEGEWSGWDGGDDDTDDWLAQLEEKQIDSGSLGEIEETEWTPPETDAAPPAGGQIEDTTSWLAGLADEDVEAGLAAESAADADIDAMLQAETPDWLADLVEEDTSEAESGDDLPAWMGEAAKTSGLNIKDVEDDDWLNVFEDDQPMATLTSHGDAPPGFGDEDEDAAPGTGGLPSWMSDLDPNQAEVAAAAVDEEYPDLPEEAGELPNWISDLQGAQGDLGSGEEDVGELGGSIPAFTAEPAVEELDIEPAELPDWLGAEASAGEQATPEGLPQGDSNLSPAELPSWLQAMRPVESAAPSGEAGIYETGEQISVGPLAGLSGVLPAEPDIVQFGKVPTLSMKLAVNEGQLSHARILEQLVASEGETRSVKVVENSLPQRITRWIIAVVLFIAVLIPVIGRKMTAPLPNVQNEIIIQRGTLPIQVGIESLPTEANILVAFDYQPGLYGEMSAAASGMVDHLLRKNAKLAYMSTEPTGSGLARRFFSDTQTDAQHNHAAQLEQLSTDLGYLAGGTAGLQLLAQNPIDALPALNVSPNLPGFGTVNDLNYFHMIVVITDDADTARAWIEQVQPRLNGTPLYMVVSAQAEPLVYPYFESDPKQVDGLIIGAAGGAVYEQSSSFHIARKYWNPYSTGVSMTLLVIIAGGAYSLIQFFITRLREREP